MSMTGDPDGDPMRTGISLIDIITGLFAGQAVLAALYERERSGEGQFVEVPLFDTGVNMLSHTATAYLIDGIVMGRVGNASEAAMPVGAYQAADGSFTLAMTSAGSSRRSASRSSRSPNCRRIPLLPRTAHGWKTAAASTRCCGKPSRRRRGNNGSNAALRRESPQAPSGMSARHSGHRKSRDETLSPKRRTAVLAKFPCCARRCALPERPWWIRWARPCSGSTPRRSCATCLAGPMRRSKPFASPVQSCKDSSFALSELPQ